MLVLAMEFSRDAQRPGSDETSWGAGRTDTRAADRLIDGRHRGRKRHSVVAPSKRNSEVRRSFVARNTGPAGHIPEGIWADGSRRETKESRITSDRLGSP